MNRRRVGWRECISIYVNTTMAYIRHIRGVSDGNSENVYVIVGCFRLRATDVKVIIPAFYAVSGFGAVNYNFLAYTTADSRAIMAQIRASPGETSKISAYCGVCGFEGLKRYLEERACGCTDW